MTRPPIDATVRHTTHYKDGTKVTIEGKVSRWAHDSMYFHIGTDDASHTADVGGKLGEYTTEFEILTPPPAPEPTTGSAAATSYTVWLRGHGGWFDGFNTDTPAVFLTWEELNTQHPEVRALVYDPLTDAKPIPWSARDIQGQAVGVERFGNRFVFKHQTQMFPIETDIATAVEGAKAILRAARECAE